MKKKDYFVSLCVCFGIIVYLSTIRYKSIVITVTVLFIVGFMLFRDFLKKRMYVRKGKKGERTVAKILSPLDENEYKVLNDVMVRTQNGKTSQIDHIVVSAYGIFVIETKNYRGWIFGNEKAAYWMQIIYHAKYRLRNPVKQNYAHIFALKEILAEYSTIIYFPIVVFVGKAELKEIKSKMPVIYDTELLTLIHSNATSKCLAEAEIDKIVELLSSKNIVNDETRVEHINTIRQTIHERELKMKNLICPRCNGTLKLRAGKSGKFYGCSNYPRCRFTLSYDNYNEIKKYVLNEVSKQ